MKTKKQQENLPGKGCYKRRGAPMELESPIPRSPGDGNLGREGTPERTPVSREPMYQDPLAATLYWRVYGEPQEEAPC